MALDDRMALAKPDPDGANMDIHPNSRVQEPPEQMRSISHRRPIASIHRWLRAALSIVWFAVVFAFALAVVMLLHAWSADLLAPIPGAIPFVLLFATLGTMYGTVVALDSSAPRMGAPKGWIKQIDSPRLRAGLCALFGIAAGTIIWMMSRRSFDWTWILLTGGLPGAVFGWLGWKFAKYIDF